MALSCKLNAVSSGCMAHFGVAMSISLRAEPIHFLEVLVFPCALLSLSPSTHSLWYGLGLSIVGLVLKLWLFSYPKMKNKKFQVYGPYRFLRHPYYCSTLLLLCSASLASRSLWLFIGALVFFIYFFLRGATKIDENRLKFFGSNYTYYKNCIGSLVPSLIPYPAATRKDPSWKHIFNVRYKTEVDTFLAVLVFYSYVFAYSQIQELRSIHNILALVLMAITIIRLARLIQYGSKDSRSHP